MYLSEIFFYSLVVIFVIGAFRNPFIGLSGYYAFSILRPQEIYWYALTGSRLSYYVAAATIIATIFHFGNRDHSVKRMNKILVFFVLFALLSLNSYAFSVSKDVSYDWLILFLKLMTMCVMTMLIVENIRQIKILIFVQIIVIGFLAYWSNLQYFSGALWEISGFPGRSQIDNNFFAMLMVAAIPLAFFWFFLGKNKILRWIPLFIIPLMIHTIVLTYSRGGFVGLIIVSICCVLYLKNRKWAILAAICFLLVILRLQGSFSEQRMSSMFEYESDPSIVGRFEAWEAGYNMMMSNPLAGVGIGNFKLQAPYYNPVFTEPKSAHNAFLNIGGDMGVISFVVYIGVWLLVFYYMIKMRKYYKNSKDVLPHFYCVTALFIALLGVFVCGMFLTLAYFELHYFLLAIIGALVNIYKRDKDLHEGPIAV